MIYGKYSVSTLIFILSVSPPLDIVPTIALYSISENRHQYVAFIQIFIPIFIDLAHNILQHTHTIHISYTAVHDINKYIYCTVLLKYGFHENQKVCRLHNFFSLSPDPSPYLSFTLLICYK